MVARGVDDLRDRPAPVERHEHVAQRVAGGMQRDRQRELGAEGGEPAHARYDARGRHGDVAGAEPEPAAIVQRLDRGQHVVEVEERLAHPHEHDVREPLSLRGQPPRRVAGLVDDLGRVEVAREPELARGAERAADRAAGLARQAERVPLAGSGPCRVVHQDGFDQRAVGKAVERLLGQPGVPEDQLGRLDRVEAEGRIQLVPERRRQGRDRGGRSGMAAPQPVGDLAGAVRPLAMLDEPGLEVLGPDAGQPGPQVTFHHARC